MQALSASDLLTAWERGVGAGPLRTSLELLSAACPEADPEDLAGVSIGQRDALLLRLRQWTFGSPLAGLADCPRCGAQIEVAFDPADGPGPDAAAAEISVVVDGYELWVRPPNSRDVMSASDPDLGRARLQLFEACLISAKRDGSAVLAGALPAAVVDEAERRLAEADPWSEIQLAVACPACDTRRTVTFDVASFFGREVDAWARRIFHEIHTLATAYGWSEQEILALTPLRRQCYLDLVGG